MTTANHNQNIKTFADLEHWLNERRVTEVECLVPDLTGVARGKILPRENSPKTEACAFPKRW